jgi:hypothetical protein
MHRALYLPGLFALAIGLLPTPAASGNVANPTDQVRPMSPKLLQLAQQCSQQVGPFATQDSAWRTLHQARAQGYAVSQGLYICYPSGSRGYCFNVFYPC